MNRRRDVRELTAHELEDRARALGRAAEDGIVLVRASDVQPKPVTWLWKPRIAVGCVTLLVGVPGLGKSLLACWIAGRISRGELDAGGESVMETLRGAADVVYATAEDGIEHTLLPRLIAADADRSRVHFVGVVRDGIDEGLTLPDDVAALTGRIVDTGARLLIIDPLMAHLGGGVDSHRDHSMRRVLAPLHRMAETTQCAVVVVAHTNKNESSDLFKRVGGSIGLTGAVRSVLLMGADPEAEQDDTARILVHGKTNIGAMAPTLRLTVRGELIHAAGQEIETAVIALGAEAPHLHVSDVLRPPEEPEDRSALADAKDYLHDALKERDRPVKQIENEADVHGHSVRTIHRARKKLRVIPWKDGMSGGWLLHLPGGEACPEGCQICAKAANKKTWQPSGLVGNLRRNLDAEAEEALDITEAAK